MPNYDEDIGWNVYMLVMSIPAWLAVVATFLVPESARWYCTVGEFEKAEEIIHTIFEINNVDPIIGRLAHEHEKVKKRGQVRDLLIPEYRLTTSVLFFSLLEGMCIYYGIIFLSERLFESSTLYFCLLVTTLSEFPGLLFGLVATDIVGRKWIMIYTSAFATVGFIVVYFL